MAGPGADLLPPDAGVPWARELNDTLAAAVAKQPDRYRGFAHLPMDGPGRPPPTSWSGPSASSASSGPWSTARRAGSSSTPRSSNPILARAERPGRPDLLAPQHPPRRRAGRVLRRPARPVGVPAVDRRLRLARGDGRPRPAADPQRHARPPPEAEPDHRPHGRVPAHDDGPATDNNTRESLSKYSGRGVAQQLREQVYVTTSGQFTTPPLHALVDTFGVDRVMFSIDYPFSPNAKGRAFLDALPLAPAGRGEDRPRQRRPRAGADDPVSGSSPVAVPGHVGRPPGHRGPSYDGQSGTRRRHRTCRRESFQTPVQRRPGGAGFQRRPALKSGPSSRPVRNGAETTSRFRLTKPGLRVRPKARIAGRGNPGLRAYPPDAGVAGTEPGTRFGPRPLRNGADSTSLWHRDRP